MIPMKKTFYVGLTAAVAAILLLASASLAISATSPNGQSTTFMSVYILVPLPNSGSPQTIGSYTMDGATFNETQLSFGPESVSGVIGSPGTSFSGTANFTSTGSQEVSPTAPGQQCYAVEDLCVLESVGVGTINLDLSVGTISVQGSSTQITDFLVNALPNGNLAALVLTAHFTGTGSVQINGHQTQVSAEFECTSGINQQVPAFYLLCQGVLTTP